ncbi:aminoglycoside phosphotransferase family protein [Aeromicrobium sp. CTD01-1L150]|uniref:aminoglycoside phosphotransferase family protein n=1 Tax=Aeromicrobium sp. CTD01-1L150 TaxID=3341830 RepID=UPI0035BEC0F0
MRPAFSETVTSQEWLDEARSWVHARGEDAGLRLVGPIEQRRVRPWSTLLVAPTDQGLVWFKANSPSMSFEAGLHQLLAARRPHDVPAPLAVDTDRGWILTTDRGVTLGDDHAPTTQDWVDVVRTVASLQRGVAEEEASFLATGLPDCSPPTVPGRLDRMVDRLSELPSTHPAHLAASDRDALHARREDVVDAAGRLASSPLPTTLQHGDVHPWNAFTDGRLLDFGDAQWAHAVEVLNVPYGWVTSESDLPWEEILYAYGEQWADVVGARELRALFGATAYTHAVNRAATWWGCLVHATDEEWIQWGDAPRHHLLRILEA